MAFFFSGGNMKKIFALLLLIAFSPYAFAVAPDIRISDDDGDVVNVTSDGKLSISGGVSTLGDPDSDDSVLGGTYAKQAFDPMGLNGVVRYYVANGHYQNAIDFYLDSALREVNITSVNSVKALTWDKTFRTNNFLAGGTKGVPTLDLTSSVISYYKFEEESGTTVADSVGSNTGTVTDDTLTPKEISTTLTAPGPSGYSIRTDGVSGVDLGNVSDFKFTGDFTVCLQARPDKTDADSGETLMGNRLASGANTGFVITLGAGGALYRTAKLTVDVGASAVTLEGTTHIDDAQYHVICVKRTTDTFALFVDGVSEGTPSGTSSASLALAGNTYIGGSPNVGFAGEFEGNIDNVLLAATAISDANILALSNWWAAGNDGLRIYDANGPSVISTTENESSSYATDRDDLIVGDDLDVQGDAHALNYFSGDGTQGFTGTCAAATTATVKDGLITACA